MSLVLGVSGGVIRDEATPTGRDFRAELPDFTDSGILERTDTLPGKREEHVLVGEHLLIKFHSVLLSVTLHTTNLIYNSLPCLEWPRVVHSSSST